MDISTLQWINFHLFLNRSGIVTVNLIINVRVSNVRGFPVKCNFSLVSNISWKKKLSSGCRLCEGNTRKQPPLDDF